MYQNNAVLNPPVRGTGLQAPLLAAAFALMAGIGAAWWARDAVTAATWTVMAIPVAGITLLAELIAAGSRRYGMAMDRALRCLLPLSLALLAGLQTRVNYGRVRVDWPEEARVWCAEVVSPYRQYTGGGGADMTISAPGEAGDGKVVRTYLRGASLDSLRPGDRLAFYAPVRLPSHPMVSGEFDYQNYLLTHGISGTAYADSGAWVKLGTVGEMNWRSRMLRLRDRLTQHYAQHWSGRQLGVISALTLGDKTLLDSDTRDLFSDTGASHVLALSGLHLSILFGLLQSLLLRRIRHRPAYIGAQLVALAALWGFVWLTGAPISLQRAAWMFTLLQVGLVLQRHSSASLNNLAFAAVCLLIIDPYSLFDVGFQLSFAAVGGIILGHRYVWPSLPLPAPWEPFSPPWRRIRPPYALPPRHPRLYEWRSAVDRRLYAFLTRDAYSFVTVSLSAQLSTLPLILYYFHRPAPYALLANVVAIPCANVLLVGALCFFLLPVPVLRDWVAEGLGTVLNWMTRGLEWVATLPGAACQVEASALTLLLSPFAVFFLYRALCGRRRRVRLHAWYLVTALCMAGVVSEGYRLHTLRSAASLNVYRVSGVTVAHFVEGGRGAQAVILTPGGKLDGGWKEVVEKVYAARQSARTHLLTDTTCRDGSLRREGDYFSFLNRSLYCLQNPIASVATDAPLSIDVLWVSRGCYDAPTAVWHVFLPRRVVLDPTLPRQLQVQWAEACARADIPCQRLSENRTFVLPIE